MADEGTQDSRGWQARSTHARKTATPVPSPPAPTTGETLQLPVFGYEAHVALNALDEALAGESPADPTAVLKQSIASLAACKASAAASALDECDAETVRSAYREARAHRHSQFQQARNWLQSVDRAARKKAVAYMPTLQADPPIPLGPLSRLSFASAAANTSQCARCSATNNLSMLHEQASVAANDDDDDTTVVDESDMLVHLRIMLPSRPDTVWQELICLASQTLDEVAHAITCEFDHVAEIAGNFCHGAYMYLPGTFVLDTSAGEASYDFSWSLRQLAQKVGLRTPDFADHGVQHSFNVVQMCDASLESFRDLVLGRLYTYCHQGICEHPVSLAEVRLKHKSDKSDRSAYPLEVYRHASQLGQLCSVCVSHNAVLATVNDELSPNNPALMCKECFEMLHPERAGERNFSVLNL